MTAPAASNAKLPDKQKGQLRNEPNKYSVFNKMIMKGAKNRMMN